MVFEHSMAAKLSITRWKIRFATGLVVTSVRPIRFKLSFSRVVLPAEHPAQLLRHKTPHAETWEVFLASCLCKDRPSLDGRPRLD